VADEHPGHFTPRESDADTNVASVRQEHPRTAQNGQPKPNGALQTTNHLKVTVDGGYGCSTQRANLAGALESPHCAVETGPAGANVTRPGPEHVGGGYRKPVLCSAARGVFTAIARDARLIFNLDRPPGRRRSPIVQVCNVNRRHLRHE
jgi:hypothetical protein